MSKDLPKVVWLFIPIVVAAMPYFARVISLDTDRYMYTEFGIIENITVVVLVIAIISCFKFLKSATQFKYLKIWIIFFLIGCVYFAGEELSWGQHFFGWSTPESWSSVNDQQETNLHNTAAIFDRIPRTLLSIAALIGGVLIPVYRRLNNHVPNENSFFDWLFPTYACLPAALLSLLVSWHEKLYSLFDTTIPAVLDIRAGETKECLLALFMMIYVLSIWYRNRKIQLEGN